MSKLLQQTPFSWSCPHCGQPTTINKHDCDSEEAVLTAGIAHRASAFEVAMIRCPAPECRRITFLVALGQRTQTYAGLGEVEHYWRLIPESSAKPQPDYIPEAIRDDYTEACRIAPLSPKAAAAIARRCLQGMIRNFWNVKGKRNLYDEIDAIKDEPRIDPGVWKAIDAVRRIGNYGAHMQQDVNLIVDVEPGEAEDLLRLIEMLFKEWYVHREERETRVADIVATADKKDAAVKGVGAHSPEDAAAPAGDGNETEPKVGKPPA